MGLPYLSLNPGSSYRGLHDSLVNYAGNEMEMLCCPHEKIAVGLAHGYAKASGRPMGVILHNVVGLLHGAMGIYYAYIDRVPVLVFGGSGPATHDRRRPNIDWIHSADVQGNAVRDFTKWDHEPRSVSDVPGTLARAYRVAMSEPAARSTSRWTRDCRKPRWPIRSPCRTSAASACRPGWAPIRRR